MRTALVTGFEDIPDDVTVREVARMVLRLERKVDAIASGQKRSSALGAALGSFSAAMVTFLGFRNGGNQ